MKKFILYCRRSLVMACDGRCDKAWGINNRPRLYFMESAVTARPLLPGEDPHDEDDYVYVRDDDLGTAPADPGTYEDDHAKPSATPIDDPELMNKWCARECERQKKFEPDEPIVLRNMNDPRSNIPRDITR